MFAALKRLAWVGDEACFAPSVNSSARWSFKAFGRSWAGIAGAFSLVLLACAAASADALDGVPIDTRARLAVAASAYPPNEAPDLDPASGTFAPDTAADFLESNADGHYATSLVRKGYQITFTLQRFADQDAAIAGLGDWRTRGDATAPLDWGGRFAAFRRGQGLLGIGLAGAGLVARGQSGRWHFEVGARVAAGESPAGSETEAAIEAMKTLASNAALYHLFPRELTVDYQIAGGAAKRLPQGKKLQLPLHPDDETAAVFMLQVLDDGQPVKPVSYRIELSGSLAALAELDEDGARSRRSVAEAQSADGEPARVTFIFPPTLDEDAMRLMDSEDASLALKVEARVAPTVLP